MKEFAEKPLPPLDAEAARKAKELRDKHKELIESDMANLSKMALPL